MKLMLYAVSALMVCFGSAAVAADDPDAVQKQAVKSEQQANARKTTSIRKKIADTVRTGTPNMGPANAQVSILAFTTPGPMSEKTVTSLKHVLSQYSNKVRIVFQLTDDKEANAVIWAADKQGKFWDVYQAVMSDHKDLKVNEKFAKQFGLDFDQLSSAMQSIEFREQVKQNQENMKELKVTEFPTFFVNTQRHIGPAGLSRVVFEHLNFGGRNRMLSR